MGLFPSTLVVSPCADGRTWALTDPFEFHYRVRGHICRLRIPQGFLTDFASVPLPFRLVLPPWGKYGRASVVHDWMYWDQTLSRRDADRVFLDAMRTLGVWTPARWTIYAGVRCFGRPAWNSNRAERARGTTRVLAAFPSDQPATGSFKRSVLSAAEPAWESSRIVGGRHSRYV